MNDSCFYQTYYETLDFVVNAIQKRFEWPDYQTHAAFKNLKLKRQQITKIFKKSTQLNRILQILYRNVKTFDRRLIDKRLNKIS